MSADHRHLCLPVILLRGICAFSSWLVQSYQCKHCNINVMINAYVQNNIRGYGVLDLIQGGQGWCTCIGSIQPWSNAWVPVILNEDFSSWQHAAVNFLPLVQILRRLWLGAQLCYWLFWQLLSSVGTQSCHAEMSSLSPISLQCAGVWNGFICSLWIIHTNVLQSRLISTNVADRQITTQPTMAHTQGPLNLMD